MCLSSLSFMRNSQEHALIYVKITSGRGLISYSDSDHVDDLEDKKNTTSVIFFMGSCPISLSS